MVILYWNENLIKSMIADLCEVDKKVIDSKIRQYGLQLNNRIDQDLYKKISKAEAAMEQEITQRVMEKYVHKTQLYRLKKINQTVFFIQIS